MITELSKKLRKAADALDELLEVRGTPTLARLINAELDTKRTYRPRKKLHWTQRPENKAKLRKNIKKMLAARHNK